MRKFLFFKDFLSIYQCVFNIFKFSELKFSITATKYTIVTIVESKKLMMVIGAKLEQNGIKSKYATFY